LLTYFYNISLILNKLDISNKYDYRKDDSSSVNRRPRKHIFMLIEFRNCIGMINSYNILKIRSVKQDR